MHVTPRTAGGPRSGLFRRGTLSGEFSGTPPAFRLAAVIRLIFLAADDHALADLPLQRARFFNQRVEAIEEGREVLGRERLPVGHDESSGGICADDPRVAESGPVQKQSRFQALTHL